MKLDTLLLKAAVVLFGLLIFGLCVVALPVGIATDRTGYYWPILLGLYIPAVPFFIAIYNALKLLGLIDKGGAFSLESVAAFRAVKFCGFAIAALFTAGMPYVYYAADRHDVSPTQNECHRTVRKSRHHDGEPFNLEKRQGKSSSPHDT